MPTTSAGIAIKPPEGVKFSHEKGKNDAVEFDPRKVSLGVLARYLANKIRAGKTTGLLQVYASGTKAAPTCWLSSLDNTIARVRSELEHTFSKKMLTSIEKIRLRTEQPAKKQA